MLVVICVLITQMVGISKSEFEGKIVNGQLAKIEDFPYTAFIALLKSDRSGWMCGSSILNQKLLLTAAHCLLGSSKTHFIVKVGTEDFSTGFQSSVHSFLGHSRYSNTDPIDDIGLVRLRTPLDLSLKVNRVVLMQHPPYDEKALVAGWGLTDDKTNESAEVLQYTRQKVLEKDTCKNLIGDIPDGTFCARDPSLNNYASRGDSGSPLVVRGYIQIGIVSYKIAGSQKDILVYTDTGYFYSWVNESSLRLLECS